MTPYGQTLLFKLAFLAGVLGLAGANLLVVKPRLKAANGLASRAGRWLRWLVTGEAVLGLVVLAAAGVLSVTAPPYMEPVRLAVTLGEGEIAPQALEVRLHRPVRLTVANRGTMLHTYVIRAIPHEMIGRAHQHGDTQDMAVYVEPGKSETVQFIPRRPGVYAVYCMVANHREEGETAVLTVR